MPFNIDVQSQKLQDLFLSQRQYIDIGRLSLKKAAFICNLCAYI